MNMESPAESDPNVNHAEKKSVDSPRAINPDINTMETNMQMDQDGNNTSLLKEQSAPEMHIESNINLDFNTEGYDISANNVTKNSTNGFRSKKPRSAQSVGNRSEKSVRSSTPKSGKKRVMFTQKNIQKEFSSEDILSNWDSTIDESKDSVPMVGSSDDEEEHELCFDERIEKHVGTHMQDNEEFLEEKQTFKYDEVIGNLLANRQNSLSSASPELTGSGKLDLNEPEEPSRNESDVHLQILKQTSGTSVEYGTDNNIIHPAESSEVTIEENDGTQHSPVQIEGNLPFEVFSPKEKVLDYLSLDGSNQSSSSPVPILVETVQEAITISSPVAPSPCTQQPQAASATTQDRRQRSRTEETRPTDRPRVPRFRLLSATTITVDLTDDWPQSEADMITALAAIEITEENLEDLLAYDDLFLDYFNAFLGLPVFPQPLYYNRLTGTFLEVNGTSQTSFTDEFARPVTPPYGATDEERERMLEWAKEERLPLFLKTELFREFKLCKLLLRPLDDRYSSSRGSSSRLIRGYSRQTESYVSSLSNSADNSANDMDFEEEGFPWAEAQGSGTNKRQRPGSRAVSLPTRLGLVYSSKSAGLEHTPKDLNTLRTDKKPSSAGSNSHDAAQQSFAGITTDASETDDTKESSKPDKSAKLSESKKKTSSLRGHKAAFVENSSNTTKQSMTGDPGFDFDTVYGETEPEQAPEMFVAFAEDVVSDQQTLTDVKQLEGKHKMTLQQMKEQVLGYVGGMEQLKQFLHGTTGMHLYNFWLDCEKFKDSTEDYDDIEATITRNRLFRDIQDRYKMTLTHAARRQIAEAASNQGLSYTIFIRTQYNVLRRIRTYWVPRFLIHKERLDELSKQLRSGLDDTDCKVQKDAEQQATSFFPSISLVNSMPVRPDDLMAISKTTSWDAISKGGRKLDERVKSAKPHLRQRPGLKTMREKLILALQADQAAGGPFRMFLERSSPNEKLLSNLLFWEEVTEYSLAQDRSADRLLCLTHAWNIFNKYIAKDSRSCIGVAPQQQDLIHQMLLTNKDFVEASIFDTCKDYCVDLMQNAWVRFLKEDLKSFIDCHLRAMDTPPGTADEIEVLLDDVNEQLIVRRPMAWVRRMRRHGEEGYPESTESERGQRLRTALSMAESIDEARVLEQRKRAKEKKAAMEKERKKAVRAARQRLKEAKMVKKVSINEGEDGEDKDSKDKSQSGHTEKGKGEQHEDQGEQIPTFAESVSNKGLMTLFKKYVSDTDNKDVLNMLSMYQDIDSYHSIPDGKKDTRHKKDTQAGYIYKTYVEGGSRKKVHLSDRFYQHMRVDRDRPKTGTLKEAQRCLTHHMEEHFKTFWEEIPQARAEYETQAEELGLDAKNLQQMSKVELAMHADDPSLLNSWKNRRAGRPGKFDDSQFRRKRKPDGRSQPRREDKTDFLLALTNASSGHLPLQMLYFYKYLVKHGEEDGCPLIDKDLFFYCEVSKFKECSHAFADEELLRRKVQSILDCYLESSTPPSLQIDITSDVQQKTVRAAQRYLTGKEIISTIFDDAQYSIFKELLPYWAGFVKNFKMPDDEKKKPLTKKEKERIKRLEDIMIWKPPSAKKIGLPVIPQGIAVTAFTFTLTEGVKWRDKDDESEDGVGSMIEDDDRKEELLGRKGRRVSALSSEPTTDTLRSLQNTRRRSVQITTASLPTSRKNVALKV